MKYNLKHKNHLLNTMLRGILIFFICNGAAITANTKTDSVNMHAQIIESTTREMLDATYGEKGVYSFNGKGSYAYTFNALKKILGKEGKFDLHEVLAQIILELYETANATNTSDSNNVNLTTIETTQGFSKLVLLFKEFFIYNYIEKMAAGPHTKITKWYAHLHGKARNIRNKHYILVKTDTTYTSGDTVTTNTKWITKESNSKAGKIVVLDIVVDELSFKDAEIAEYQNLIEKGDPISDIINKLTDELNQKISTYQNSPAAAA